jgi:dipeptidyl aminopeptidase/acylaminoacyl peptidase
MKSGRNTLIFLSNLWFSKTTYSFTFSSKLQSRRNFAVPSNLASSKFDHDIIPRSVLFGNPTFSSPNLSPDGKFLAYLAPSLDHDILNVFVRDIDGIVESTNMTAKDMSCDRQITNDTFRGIRRYFWAQDSETILYLQDNQGDENFHLWAIAITDETPTARDLTPGHGVKASSVFTNKRYPNEILVATNARNSSLFDIYRCHYREDDESLRMKLDTLNPGNIIGWDTEDESFEIRVAIFRNPIDSSTTIKVRDSSEAPWRDLITLPFGEEGSLLTICPGGETCLMTSSIGRETKALWKVHLQSGKNLELLSCHEKCDVGGVSWNDDTKEVRSVTYNYARTERVFLDEELKLDFDTLTNLGPCNAEVSVVSKNRDETIWVIAYSRSDGPTEYKLYIRHNQSLINLFVSKPDLLSYNLVPMRDVRIKARDGLELVAYLTQANVRKSTTPNPLVLLVHGGPWARDYWGFSPTAQWFANRGYTTLQVNFRGSTGYGKSFLHKGDGEWGIGAMQHDLTDAVQWAIDNGIADPQKICIYGGSYGGYACLAGLTFTPELYTCGVDIVGPSNVKTLLDSIPPYWGPLRNQMLLKIGNVDLDDQFNRQISPLFHIDKIQAPLLIGHGANDPRVKQTEADQIAFSMQQKGIPVEYVLYPDEGHGFVRPDNRIDFNGRVELFLEKHLGGRSEPFYRPEGSSAIFPLQEHEL